MPLARSAAAAAPAMTLSGMRRSARRAEAAGGQLGRRAVGRRRDRVGRRRRRRVRRLSKLVGVVVAGGLPLVLPELHTDVVDGRRVRRRRARAPPPPHASGDGTHGCAIR